jgi:hypothetical protein
VKAAALVLVALIGFGLYHLYASSEKWSAAKLEAFLENNQKNYQPNHIHPFQCQSDPGGRWD